jgi:AcrR family transcriptional regulator
VPRPRIHDDTLRGRLIDAAARVLAEEGPHAVTTRRIANEVGTSTTAIYTLLGSKTEMFRAMYLEGFSRLAARQSATAITEDPLADLCRLGRAYFENGLENPHLYDVMFHRPVQGFTPEPDDVAFARSTLQDVVDTVQRAIDQGAVHGDAHEVATEVWAVAHGVTSLTIAGMLDRTTAGARLDHLMLVTTTGYRAEARA